MNCKLLVKIDNRHALVRHVVDHHIGHLRDAMGEPHRQLAARFRVLYDEVLFPTPLQKYQHVVRDLRRVEPRLPLLCLERLVELREVFRRDVETGQRVV